jgi:hypothetical protein
MAYCGCSSKHWSTLPVCYGALSASIHYEVYKSMTALKNTAVGIFVLVALQLQGLGPCYSQVPDTPKFKEEFSKQEGIYKSQGESVPQGYVIDRSLLAYTFALSSGFDQALAKLGPADRWLDIGAGEGQAILDYYGPRYDSMHAEGRVQRGTKAQAAAISIEDRRTPLWHQTAATLEANKIRYLFGKRLREYTLEDLGQYQLITDVLGGFSYTSDITLFMEKALGFLAVNGSFFTILQDVHSESESNRPFYAGAPYLTEIKNADGSEVKVCSWLKRITCVEVTCEFKSNWKPPVETYQIQKVCDNVTVPALVPKHFAAGTPPERGFQAAAPLTLR